MKFLVLALCVCAASAASIDTATIKPWQFQRSAPQVQFGQAQALAKAEVAPQVVLKANGPVTEVVEQPAAVKVVAQPIVKAVPTPVYNAPTTVYTVPTQVYNAPVAAARSAVYPSAGLAKNVYTDKETTAAVLRSESDVAPNGFTFTYETENGIAAQSSGVLKSVDNNLALAIQGSYQYVDRDGRLIQVTYIADENGFQPKSDILPVGPAIPEEIARSLEYLRSNPVVKPEIYN